MIIYSYLFRLSFGNHSISVWVNHSGTNDVIFSAQDSSSDGIRLFIDDGNRLQYKINGTNALVTSASYPNQWVHYVCTYDGSTMRKMYANGVEVKTNATYFTNCIYNNKFKNNECNFV